MAGKGMPRSRFTPEPQPRHSVSFRTIVGSVFRPTVRPRRTGVTISRHAFEPLPFYGTIRRIPGRRWFK